MEKDVIRTADASEMAANQQGYELPSIDNDIVVIQDGVSKNKDSVDGVEADITSVNMPQLETQEVLFRTDADTINEAYKTQELQTHGTPSGLDITSYNVYAGVPTSDKKPEKVVVGVAGTDTKNMKDMPQNLNVGINRSDHSEKSVENLKNEADKHPHPWNYNELIYELDTRKTVEALKKYRQNNISIILAGDSKGGEDASYLALRFVDSTQPEGQNDKDYRDYSAVNLHLTNPKGIRVSDADYAILEKMADAGNITIEVVYPEILSDGLGHGLKADGTGKLDGRPILCKPENKFYTVPNNIKDLLENHTINNYKDDVYQGVGNLYKFQGNEVPEAILNEQKLVQGYRYTITNISDKSGNTISVSNYFFLEQQKQIDRLKEKLLYLKDVLVRFDREDIAGYFYNKTGEMKTTLGVTHKLRIQIAVPFTQYKRDHPPLQESEMTIIDKTLYESKVKREYDTELENHIDAEKIKYPSVVVKNMSEKIRSYKESVHNEVSKIEKRIVELEQKSKEIEAARLKQATALEQIKLVIEKRV